MSVVKMELKGALNDVLDKVKNCIFIMVIKQRAKNRLVRILKKEKEMNESSEVKNQDSLNEEMLILHFLEKMKISKIELATFCMAFIFEPGIKTDSNVECKAHHYVMQHIPESLPKYLESFKVPSTQIFDGPTPGECNDLGSDFDTRYFFLCEGLITCKKCNSQFC